MTDQPRPPRPPSRSSAGPRGPRPGAPRGPRDRRDDEPPTRDPARDRAYRRISKQVRRYPHNLLITPLGDEGLSAVDASFAHALYDVVMRRWITLEHLASLGLKRDFETLDASVQAAILAGSAQMLLMETIPPRAALNESVTWAKRVTRTDRAGGFVNAALRRVSELIGEGDTPEGEEPSRRWPPRRERYEGKRDELPLANGRAVPLAFEVLPEDPLQRLAIATGHPLDLLRLWSKSMSLREVRALAMHGITRPPVILNTAHVQTPPPAESVTPHTAPGHHVFTGSHAELVRLLERRSDLWVQDPASSLAVESVADLRPKLIVDACAGQGTKTRQLAAMFPDAHIVATDIDVKRRVALAEVFQSHPDAKRVTVINHADLSQWASKADLALLDVPCSNTGVLARRVEARYRASESAVAELGGLQRQIVADAVKLLAPGGALLYSTCSLDPRENDDMVEWAVRWHGFESTRQSRRLPAGGPGEPDDRYSDGSFAALLS